MKNRSVLAVYGVSCAPREPRAESERPTSKSRGSNMRGAHQSTLLTYNMINTRYTPASLNRMKLSLQIQYKRVAARVVCPCFPFRPTYVHGFLAGRGRIGHKKTWGFGKYFVYVTRTRSSTKPYAGQILGRPGVSPALGPRHQPSSRSSPRCDTCDVRLAS